MATGGPFRRGAGGTRRACDLAWSEMDGSGHGGGRFLGRTKMRGRKGPSYLSEDSLPHKTLNNFRHPTGKTGTVRGTEVQKKFRTSLALERGTAYNGRSIE